MQLNLSFWAGKSVLITGHTGFKGTWLSKTLVALGAKVSGYSLPPSTNPNIFETSKLANYLNHHMIGNICNKDQLNVAFSKVEPDVLFHMAAQPIVSLGYEKPLETFDTNVMGTVNVLDEARHMQPGAPIIVVSSDKCYLNMDQGRAFVETDHLGGRDPYSASKAGTEIVASAFQSSYFSTIKTPRLATARAGNVIGGGDWSKNRLIPDLARSYQSKQPITLRMPEATRPWQFVMEPLIGYVLLAQALSENSSFKGAWNFGPDETGVRKVVDVIRAICDCWEIPPSINMSSSFRSQHEATTLAVNSSKAKNELGWLPQLSTQEAIEWTAEWYDSHFNGSDGGKALLEKQISDYLKRVDSCDA